jgi:hypothetical protein
VGGHVFAEEGLGGILGEAGEGCTKVQEKEDIEQIKSGKK